MVWLDNSSIQWKKVSHRFLKQKWGLISPRIGFILLFGQAVRKVNFGG